MVLLLEGCPEANNDREHHGECDDGCIDELVLWGRVSCSEIDYKWHLGGGRSKSSLM